MAETRGTGRPGFRAGPPLQEERRDWDWRRGGGGGCETRVRKGLGQWHPPMGMRQGKAGRKGRRCRRSVRDSKGSSYFTPRETMIGGVGGGGEGGDTAERGTARNSYPTPSREPWLVREKAQGGNGGQTCQTVADAVRDGGTTFVLDTTTTTAD